MLKCRYADHDFQNKMIQGICISKNCTMNRAFCSLCLRELFHHEHPKDLLDIQDFQEWALSILKGQEQLQPHLLQLETNIQSLITENGKRTIPNEQTHKQLSIANALFYRLKELCNSQIIVKIIQVEEMTHQQINLYVPQIIWTKEFYQKKILQVKRVENSILRIYQKMMKINLLRSILSYYKAQIIKPKIIFREGERYNVCGQRGGVVRVAKELNHYWSIHDQTNLYKFFPYKGNLGLIQVIFLGAKFTIFDGGIYQLQCEFTIHYPLDPPKIKLNTLIYHPNIKDQEISLNILQKDNGWSPAILIYQTILSIIGLLDEPNPEDPLNIESAMLYKNDRNAYNKKVEEYKLQYASPSVDQLIRDILGVSCFNDPDYVFLKENLTEWLNYWKNFKG